jgi:hypothetical protein
VAVRNLVGMEIKGFRADVEAIGHNAYDAPGNESGYLCREILAFFDQERLSVQHHPRSVKEGVWKSVLCY